MAPDTPLSRLILTATSVSDDLSFVALHDLACVLGSAGDAPYRVIGGQMVTALIHRRGLGNELARDTGDVDLGVPPVVVRESDLISGLLDLGYERNAGNRFRRVVDDIPVQLAIGRETARAASIDILVPAYTSRARNDRKVGKNLVTTEVPGLAFALSRDPVTMAFEFHRLNGERLDVVLAFPDEVAALVLKGLATTVRSKDTDVSDVWRCLEIAFAAGVQSRAFDRGEPARSAAAVRVLFGDRNGPGMHSLIEQDHLSVTGADQRFTRLQALISRVLGG